DVERRLKAEKLKPKLNVNYNLLQTAATPSGDSEFFYPGLFANNFKWGVSLGFPIFLREARGNLELTRIKQRETGLKQDLKRQELANKVQAYATEMENIAGQIDLSRVNVAQYEALFEAEILKFQAGESSIFLINSRENKLIDARLKLQSLQAKYGKATAGLIWSAGAWDFE
ncbi:MAG: transporter, partial [Bacteroidetes bacterium]